MKKILVILMCLFPVIGFSDACNVLRPQAQKVVANRLNEYGRIVQSWSNAPDETQIQLRGRVAYIVNEIMEKKMEAVECRDIYNSYSTLSDNYFNLCADISCGEFINDPIEGSEITWWG